MADRRVSHSSTRNSYERREHREDCALLLLERNGLYSPEVCPSLADDNLEDDPLRNPEVSVTFDGPISADPEQASDDSNEDTEYYSNTDTEYDSETTRIDDNEEQIVPSSEVRYLVEETDRRSSVEDDEDDEYEYDGEDEVIAARVVDAPRIKVTAVGNENDDADDADENESGPQPP